MGYDKIIRDMEILRIDPPNWFANMNNRTLQLIVYGNDLLGVHVSLEYQQELKETIVSNTYDYLILNIDISKVKSNTHCVLSFEKGGVIIKKKYHFLARRDKQTETLSMKDAIYLLMPDRFSISRNKYKMKGIPVDKNKPNCWHGGTIEGMTAHLDDIADMGFSAVWHTPVLENDQQTTKDTEYYDYHGYAITDYYLIDPHFGNIVDYCDFVDAAHKKGIKVIMDMVFNHCGIDHPFVKRPPVDGWFNCLGRGKYQLTNFSPLTSYDKYASSYDKQHFVKGWFTSSMPDINLSNTVVLDYMTQMTIWWVETADIDAFRIDTYPYAGVEHMEAWQRRLYAEYPGFPLLAEAWVGETEYVSRMQNDNLASIPDSTMTFMDFAFQRRISEAMGEKNVKTIYTHFALDYAYNVSQNLLAFIDNHDVARWLYKHPSVAGLKQAVGLLLTIPRIPQVYYGTEIMLAGDGKGTSDGNMRQDYPWGKPLNAQQKDFKDYLSRLLKWRRGCRSITEGEMIHFVPFDNNVYVYFRFLRNEKGGIASVVMVILNFSDKQEDIDMSRFDEMLSGCKIVRDVIGNYDCSQDLGDLMAIGAHDIMILELNRYD